jgi:hypothetical protein
VAVTNPSTLSDTRLFEGIPLATFDECVKDGAGCLSLHLPLYHGG